MPLYIALSAYQRPQEDVAAALQSHRAWIELQYAERVMLASGRRNPATGGVMILRAKDREEAFSIIAGDPFASSGIALYDIHEFDPTPSPWRSAELDAFLAD